MNAFIKTTLSALSCLAVFASASVWAQDAQQESLRILFIGNSFTFYNSLNDMTQGMLNVSGVPTEAKRSAPGGWRLSQHFEGKVPNEKTKPTPDVVKSAKWDIVVLQEQSAGSVEKRAEFLEFGKKLNDFILENNPQTKVLLYQTWARCDGMFEGYGDDEARKAEVLAAWEKRYSAPSDDIIASLKDGIRGGYDALARATGATVVPVGEAFHSVGTSLDLYSDEGDKKPFHPNPRGTYLAACCFFKTITKQSPVGMWKKLNDAGLDYKVSAEDAECLEMMADETVK